MGRSGGSGGGARFAIQIAIRARDLASTVVRNVSEQIKRSFSGMMRRLRSVVDFGAKLGTVFATWGAGLLNVARRIAGVVSETSDFLSAVSDLSKKTGISTNTLQELGFAAEQSGVEADALNKGIEVMSRNFGNMAAGGKELANFLLEVGGPAFLAQAKAAKTNEERLELMLAALGKIDGEEKRAAFAAKVFGKAGEDLSLIVADGSDKLAELRKQAHLFGVVQGPEAVGAAEEFGDEMAKVGAAWKGAQRTFGAEVMRQLLPMLREMTDWISRNPAKIREMARELAGGVVSAVTTIRDGIAWIWEHREDIAKWADGLVVAFTAAAAAISPLLAGIAALMALATKGKPATQAERDQAVIQGFKQHGTLGGAMSVMANALNEGGAFGGGMGLAQGVMSVGAFVTDQDRILAEMEDRRRADNFAASEAFNAQKRIEVLARGGSLDASTPGPDQSVEVTVNIKDPGGNTEGVPKVTTSTPAMNVKVKKASGQRTAGTGLP